MPSSARIVEKAAPLAGLDRRVWGEAMTLFGKFVGAALAGSGDDLFVDLDAWAGAAWGSWCAIFVGEALGDRAFGGRSLV